jgi:DNA (cytosine-5)-methyltransferase 1
MIKSIDLFAGLGGIRLGVEQACLELGLLSETVFTSEIKPSAVKALNKNFPNHFVSGDITNVIPHELPDFDVLLAGFPCQPFSYAGSGKGFADTRGTLFFTIQEILKVKKPSGFILENVEGLVKHDIEKGSKIGKTLQTIINTLEELGYHTSWKVLNSVDFGVPQERKRIYIVGSVNEGIGLSDFDTRKVLPRDVIEKGLPVEVSPITSKLLSSFKPDELVGKRIKDKRGGEDNIHSWDLELKGPISKDQSILLSKILTARRQKKWASEIGIDWMDGMPLTLSQIKTFISIDRLESNLDELVKLGYLRLEHPKAKVSIFDEGGKELYSIREYDKSKPKGYNIVSGKLSFPINEIVNPSKPVRTLVASDMSRIYVFDEKSKGLRKLSRNECLRLSGYPKEYKSDFGVTDTEFYDLIGNTVCVPVIKAVAKKLLEVIAC